MISMRGVAYHLFKCTASAGLVVPRNTAEAAVAVKAASAAGQNVRVVTPNKWSITSVICKLVSTDPLRVCLTRCI
jgi:hypothetical protein